MKTLLRKWRCHVGYIENNLISGETITYRGRVHWTALVSAIIPTMLLDLLGGALVFAAFSYKREYRSIFLLAALVLFFISGIVLLKGVLYRKASEFVITNKRVIAKTGVLQKQTSEIFLSKIESVGVDQSVTARALGYGSIAVRGTGGSVEMFQRIANPFEFRRQVQEQIGRLGEAAAIAK